MEIKFKRFNPLTDTIKPFDCGDADLNGFLLESNEDVPNATQHAKQLLAVTYLIEDIESGKTVAYFSLLHDRIEVVSTCFPSSNQCLNLALCANMRYTPAASFSMIALIM